LQGKISSDGCLKKEQMVVSAIASTPHFLPKIPNIVTFLWVGEPALRNDQPTETVTPTVPYGSPP
ncbi:hypothetical protein, partial [Escherichia coli]|uniref:hypothetical protein n=1 Tax=Escherichia coli TaxID=562 RepID=UPI000BE36913